MVYEEYIRLERGHAPFSGKHDEAIFLPALAEYEPPNERITHQKGTTQNMTHVHLFDIQCKISKDFAMPPTMKTYAVSMSLSEGWGGVVYMG